jgi:RNA polymerase sigma-70 factor (ECF subfamily)
MTPSDPDLVRAARAGDAIALGMLLERHRARMHAVALAMLGHGPPVEDAVQDAFMVALRHIEDLRDPRRQGPGCGASRATSA